MNIRDALTYLYISAIVMFIGLILYIFTDVLFFGLPTLTVFLLVQTVVFIIYIERNLK